ncbi:MAG: amidase family protein, partial [Dehalococcoidia bacterium]
TIDPGAGGVDPDVAEGVRKAASALAAAGYIVEEAEPPSIVEGAELWGALLFADVNATLRPVMERTASRDAMRVLDFFTEIVPALDLEGYMTALSTRHGIAREWAQFQEARPLILGPVSTLPPFPVGADLRGVDEMREIVDSMRLVVNVNLLGLPSVALPVGTAQGLPQGVQIIGPRFREDLCLDAAEAIETRVGVITPIDPRS